MQQANTLIIFCDQHNPFVSGCYGNTIVHTPNIDALAQRGTLFENAYTPNPICVPARASFVTGRYASSDGYWDNCHAYDGNVPSWGHRLKEAGIDVTTIGKLHFKDDSEHTFPGQRIPMNITDGLGDPLTACRTLTGGKSNISINQIKTAGVGEADYIKYDKRIARDAAEYLKTEAACSDKPWCLYVGFTTPHNPYNVPEKYIKQYEPYNQFEVSKEWHDDSNLHPALQEFRHRKRLHAGELTDEDIQKAIAAYYGMVSFMDDMTGIVLNALEEAGLSDTTRVIYMDDHGDLAGTHGLFFKCNMYEGSAHIPLIVAGPDIPVGKRIAAPANIIDIYPTLLDFFNLKANEYEKKLPGISLTSHIRGEVPYDRPVYSEYFGVGYSHSVYMLRKGDYKLVYYVGFQACQLFNLKDDPNENYDLGTLDNYQDKVEELKEELRKIVNPEEVDKESLLAQDKMFEERGGLDYILKNRKGNVVPFTPVPKGFI